MTEDKHSRRSAEREEYVEYMFLADLCRHAWKSDRFVEITRAQTDAFGYDLVLSVGDITRHVQLKASVVNGSTRSQKVNSNLSAKTSGCVVWLKVDPATLAPHRYGWFGGKPGAPLPDLGSKIARHSKGNALGQKNLRPAIREIGWAQFEMLDTAEQVFDRLFGAKTGV